MKNVKKYNILYISRKNIEYKNIKALAKNKNM